jgi:hypothetical protein
MAQQTNLLGAWRPTSITFIVNDVEYKGYPAPMDWFSALLEMSILYRKQINYGTTDSSKLVS